MNTLAKIFTAAALLMTGIVLGAAGFAFIGTADAVSMVQQAVRMICYTGVALLLLYLLMRLVIVGVIERTRAGMAKLVPTFEELAAVINDKNRLTSLVTKYAGTIKALGKLIVAVVIAGRSLASAMVLLGTMVTFAMLLTSYMQLDRLDQQNKLLTRQNDLVALQNTSIADQTQLLRTQTTIADRNAEKHDKELSALISLLDHHSNESSTDGQRTLPDHVAVRITDATRSFHPYRRAMESGELGPLESPERGRLLLYLTQNAFGLRNIISTESDFSYARLSKQNLSNVTIESDVEMPPQSIPDLILGSMPRTSEMRLPDPSSISLTPVSFFVTETIRFGNSRPPPIGGNLRSAHLDGALLVNAMLRYANLSSANLEGADLSGADLRRAVLLDANIRGSSLGMAHLSGADMRTHNLAREQIESAHCWDGDTRWPPGITISPPIRPHDGVYVGVDMRAWKLNDELFLRGVMPKSNLTDQNLAGRNIECSNLNHANLTGCDLSGTIFSEAKLVGADMRCTVIDNTVFDHCDLRSASFRLPRGPRTVSCAGAHLEGTYFQVLGVKFDSEAIPHCWNFDTRWHDHLVVPVPARPHDRDYTGFDMRAWDMRYVDFREASFRHANLSGVDLRRIVLDSTDLREARLERADLIETTFLGVHLAGTNLKDAKGLDQSIFDGLHCWDRKTSWPSGIEPTVPVLPHDIDYRNLDLRDWAFAVRTYEGAVLIGADLTGARLESKVFDGADLRRAKMRDTELGGASFEGAHLAGTDLSGANGLSSSVTANVHCWDNDTKWPIGLMPEVGIRPHDGDYSGADMTQWEFNHVRFPGGNFSGCNLSNADLSCKDLSEGDFRRALMTKCTLTDANLRGVHLCGADLSIAEGLKPEQLGEAHCWDSTTKWPVGMKPRTPERLH